MPITTQVDTDNQFGWDTRVQEYDGTGWLVASNKVYHNGIEIAQTFVPYLDAEFGRSVETVLRIDQNDLVGSSTISTRYVQNSVVPLERITTSDDGRVQTVNWDYDRLVAMEEDLGNAYAWSSRTAVGEVLDASDFSNIQNWLWAEINVINDDQTEEYIELSEGIVLTHRITDDL